MKSIKYSNGLCDRDGKQRLVIIAGPTAVGKSRAAVELAKHVNGEVISADSMQVYRGMDIGSAKVTREEMDGVPHHLIDVIDPHEDYNVVRFQAMAKAAIRETASRGKLPILCGGTGFYIQALLYDIDFTEEKEEAEDKDRETQLWRIAQTKEGAASLHAKLAACDKDSAAAIPAANKKRVIRALLFYERHGIPISVHNRQQEARKENAPYDYRFFVLTDEREALYARIDKRVDDMMAAGLLTEVQRLRAFGVARESTAMQGIGYRELYRYLDGELSLDEAVRLIKQDSRHYAKRQLTWFRREKNVIWIDIGKKKDIEHELETNLF